MSSGGSERVASAAPLSHVDSGGSARMVDVGAKPVTAREAAAEAFVKVSEEALEMARRGNAPKGSVLDTARLAGIQAAKSCATLIPLCHPLPITKVALELEPDRDLPGVRISAEVKTTGQTGVEMEALTAVSVAALTV